MKKPRWYKYLIGAGALSVGLLMMMTSLSFSDSMVPKFKYTNNTYVPLSIKNGSICLTAPPLEYGFCDNETQTIKYRFEEREICTAASRGEFVSYAPASLRVYFTKDQFVTDKANVGVFVDNETRYFAFQPSYAVDNSNIVCGNKTQ